MSADLHPGAQCWCLFIDNQPAAFTAVLHRPIGGAVPVKNNIKACSRLVTLPDYQGLGLGSILNETIGSAYTTLGYRYRVYPAHPALISQRVKSPNWMMVKKPGYKNVTKQKSTLPYKSDSQVLGSRPCAIFEYCGPTMEEHRARQIIQL